MVLKKTSKTNLLVFAICLLFMLSAAIGMSIAHAEDAEFEAEPYADCAVGDLWTVHDGSFIVGGENVKAKHIITFPSGRAYSANSIELTEAGQYAVEYYATVGETRYSETLRFKAFRPTFGIAGMGAADYRTFDFRDTPDIGTLPYDPNYDFEILKSEPITGEYITLGNNSSVQYAGVIDFAGKTQSDTIFEMYVMPSVIGENDFQKLTVRFTDVVDPENYIDVAIEDCDDNDLYGMVNGWAKAAPPKELLTGCFTQKGYIHKGDLYGQPTNASFSGINWGGASIKAAAPWRMSIDYARRIVYANDLFVVDLDDPQYFTNLWNGFTIDKAYMSIRFDRFEKTEGHIMITELDGCNLENPKYADSYAPVLSVDTGEYTIGDIPFGIVGEKYRVFPAATSDYDSDIVASDISVYYNYGADKEFNVDFDGEYFTPESAGMYGVVYTAVDGGGNKSEFAYPVRVYRKEDKPLAVSYSAPTVNASQGEKVTLAMPDTVNACGKPSVSYTVTLNGEEIFKGNGEATFIPRTASDHTVTATVVDYVGRSESASYTLKVSPASAPVFIGDYEKLIPHNFIAGYEYELPEINAFDFAANAESESVITASSGSVTGRKFTPELGNGEVTIVYTSGGSRLEFTRPVYTTSGENGKLDMRKFFITSSGVQSKFEESNMVYVAYDIPVGSSTLEFFNALSDKSFAFTMSLSAPDFDSFTISLKDSVTDKVLNVVFGQNEDGPTVSVNGLSAYTVAASAFKDLSVRLASDGTLRVGTLPLAVSKWADGTPYDGFASHKLIMTISVETQEPFTLQTRSVNGQTLTDRTRDDVRPIINVFDSPTGRYPIGTEVTLGDMVATDVISPVVKDLSVTVVAPDGTLLYDNAAIDNYKITLSQYGTYFVRYTATDSSGRTQTNEISLMVLDEQPPVLTVEKAQETAYVGSSVAIAGYGAKDNVSDSENIKVKVFIRSPLFDYEMLKDGITSFTPTVAGKYTVVYYAYDEAGNYSTYEYAVYAVDA